MSLVAAASSRTYKHVGLHHVFLATTLTAGLPFLGIMLVARMDGRPSALLLGVVATGLAMAASTLGTAVWMRHPASDSVSFGELMLWSWLRRANSDRALAYGNRELDESVSSLTPAARLVILREMSHALDRKDSYTFGHSRRVERLAHATGLALNLSPQEQDALRVAAAIHDVGKIHVPDDILRKEGPLTDEEYRAVTAHASMGAEMVAHMGKAEITEAVRHHHERWDGRGYPDGISGEEIPLSARIIGVVDAYDAMTSTRSYRSSLGRKRAIEVLREESGAQFDAEVVAAFLTTMRKPVALVLSLPATSVAPLVRHLAQWFGRSAGAPVATAAGAAGLAFVVSISGVTPFTESRRVDLAQAGDDGSVRVLGTVIRADDGARPSTSFARQTGVGQPSGDRKDRHRARSNEKAGSRSGKGTGGNGKGRGSGGRDESGDGSAAVASSGSGGSTGSGSTGSGSTSAATGSVGTQPVDTVKEPVKDTTQDWDPAASTDPKPGRGADCDNASDTKGGSIHCGG